jgi:hypothetical protein
MSDKTRPRGPLDVPPTPGGGPAPEEHSQEAASLTEEELEPYDDLWDPDMNTRPERIRCTKARPLRPKAPLRGKRREEA